VQDIPPQYGPGYDEEGSGAEEFAAVINGKGKGAWKLPLAPFNAAADVEPVKPFLNEGERSHREEAAYVTLFFYRSLFLSLSLSWSLAYRIV
jgi:glutathione S-transferase